MTEWNDQMPEQNLGPRWSGLHEAIVQQAPDAIIFADRDGAIRVWNRAAESIFGYAAAEVLGQSLDIIIPERLRAAHWAGFDKALATGETKYAGRVLTTRSMHKDGRRLYVDLSFSLVKDDSGGFAGALAIARDTTERYLAERDLRARVAELEKKAAPPT
jgi:PAS domain S-box-containing protein